MASFGALSVNLAHRAWLPEVEHWKARILLSKQRVEGHDRSNMTLSRSLEDVRFTTGPCEEIRVPPAQKFEGLDDADRTVLSNWLGYADARGIDAAVDLFARPWGVTGAGAIVGVFEAGHETASWLVLRHGARWTLARCADGSVSDALSSLPAILALIDADQTLAD
jgi:hypothetical protein